MSTDQTPAPDSLPGVHVSGLVATLRRLASPLLNAYGISVSGGGLALLALATLLFPPTLDPSWFVFFLLLSICVRQLGFPLGGLTNSLFGIVDLTTLLLFGPVAAAWQSALAVLLQETATALMRTPRTSWTLFKLPLFNAGLKTFMSLAGGGVYLLLGGRLRPVSLDAPLIAPGLALIVLWFSIDYGGWSLLELLSGGRTRFFQWTRYAVTQSLMVELLPLPFAFMGAAVAVSLGRSGIVMFALGLVLVSLAVRLVAQARARLEQRVSELATLNRASEEIIRASLSEQDICEIIYRYASRVVDTTFFLLGLIDEGGETETLAVLAAKGERQETRTLPVGGVVIWMKAHRRPLVVADLRKEALPFAPRQVGANAGLVRSALFVPMLAGDDLIGFMSIQSQAPNSFTPHDTRILSAMASQAAMALANLRLHRQAEVRARLERELRLARDIQRSLLPTALPQVPGLEISADWRSAREVSGDFYDFLPLSNNRLGVIIGDVSDKGVPAALFMALSRSLVRSGLLGASSPAVGLRRANRWIIKDTSSDMFLTLFYCILDPANMTLTYVNAGHNPPLLFTPADHSCRYLDQHGIALGVIDGAEYEEHTITLSRGDVLVCYTDGVTDAMRADSVAFGEQRLREVASQDCTLPAAQIVARVNEAVAQFIGDEPPFDDATLIVVRCT